MLTGKNYYAFGDSFTWGQGLPDCYHPDIDLEDSIVEEPSKLTYANKLADHYGLNLINCSRPGSSPISQFIRFNYHYPKMKMDDLVTFLWPYSMRSAIIIERDIWHPTPFNYGMNIDSIEEDLQNQNWWEISILPNMEESTHPTLPGQQIDIEKYYSDYQTELNSLFLLSTYMQSVRAMCDAKGIHYVDFVLHAADLDKLKQVAQLNIPQTEHIKKMNLPRKAMEEYTTFSKIRKRINAWTGLNMWYAPDGHFNEDTHIFWANKYRKHIDRLSY